MSVALKLAMCCVPALTLSPQTPPFRAETRVVQIPVSVTDSVGKTIEGLTAKDFLVLDDSHARAVTMDVFGSGAAPISLVIAIQTSGLNNPALQKIRRIGSLIEPLVIGRRGEVAVLTFDYTIAWRLEFSKEPAAVQRAIVTLEPGDYKQARMFDAAVAASAKLKDRSGRKVLLLISAVTDKGSKVKSDSVLEVLAREGIEVFAAPYSLSSAAAQNDLDALTDATGGSQYPFAKQSSAEKAIENLGVELHSQYILSFPQTERQPGRHKIEVSVPNRPYARIRARRAYGTD